MSRLNRFEIIIVHRNGEAIIKKCLNAVADCITDHDHVTVVDNGSEDGSCGMIKREFPLIPLIENGCNNGFAAANNQAIKQSTAQYYLLLNNDAILAEDTLSRFTQVFENNPKVAVIAPQLIGSQGEKQRSYGVFMKPWDEVLPRFLCKKNTPNWNAELVDVYSVIGACLAVRSSSIDEVGLLDEDFFFYFEETEWCHRFKKKGYRVVLDQNTQVIHAKGESTRSVRKEAQIEMLRSRLTYYKKVFRKDVASLLEAYRYVRLLINFIFALLLLLLTVGMHEKTKNQCVRYGIQLAWLLMGKPWSWGLPGKCPKYAGKEK